MKSNGKNAIIIAVIALLMTASLVGGYKAVTYVSSEVKKEFDSYTDPIVEKFYEDHEEMAPFEYKGVSKREYSGPFIYQAGGYIFNSEGKVLEEYRNEMGNEFRMTKNIDASEAVLVLNRKCIYMDANLKTTEISDNCGLAGMCFDGGYFFCLIKDGFNDGVYIYDISTGNMSLVRQGKGFHNVCISPDGKTLVYNFLSDPETIYVKGIDTEEKAYSIDEEADVIATVSDDGETVFYSCDDEYYCLNHGKVTDLGEKNIYKDYLTRDCKQIIFHDDEGNIRYYRAGDKKPSVLVKNDKVYMNIHGAAVMEQDIYMSEYVVDADSFSDVMMIVGERKCYALYGNTPEAVAVYKGDRSAYGFSTYVTGDGPAYVYEDENRIWKAVFDGKSITSTVLFECEETSVDFVCSDDLSYVWVRDGRKIYLVKENAEPVLVAEIDKNSRFTTYDFRWDRFENRFCYIVDGNLCTVGETKDSIKTIMSNAATFESYLPGDSKAVCVKSSDGERNIIIRDNILTY